MPISPREFRDNHFSIEAKLDLIYELLHDMHNRSADEVVSAAEASRRFGVPQSRVLKPWNIPDFGKFGTKLKWNLWREWWDIPEKARREKYDLTPWRERSA